MTDSDWRVVQKLDEILTVLTRIWELLAEEQARAAAREKTR